MIHRVETDTIVDDGKTIRSILGVKHNNGRYEAMVVYENNKCEHLSTELMTKYPAAALVKFNFARVENLNYRSKTIFDLFLPMCNEV